MGDDCVDKDEKRKDVDSCSEIWKIWLVMMNFVGN